MMLLSDGDTLQGVSPTSSPVAESPSARQPHSDDRHGCGEPSHAAFRFANQVKWLIGLRFHNAGHRPVWMYYVVDEAFDRTEAVHVAIGRGYRDSTRVVEAGCHGELGQVEVQQIVRDPLGQIRLTRPS